MVFARTEIRVGPFRHDIRVLNPCVFDIGVLPRRNDRDRYRDIAIAKLLLKTTLTACRFPNKRSTGKSGPLGACELFALNKTPKSPFENGFLSRVCENRLCNDHYNKRMCVIRCAITVPDNVNLKICFDKTN